MTDICDLSFLIAGCALSARHIKATFIRILLLWPPAGRARWGTGSTFVPITRDKDALVRFCGFSLGRHIQNDVLRGKNPLSTPNFFTSGEKFGQQNKI